MSNLRRLTVNLEENHFIYKNERGIYTLKLEQYDYCAAYATILCAVLG